MNANQVISFNLTDAGLAELSEKYMPLTVRDPYDSDGYHAVKTARLDVKARRVAVEKTRVEMKADALEYGRRVDAEAKRITAKLAHIEAHLEAQEAIVTNELARRKRAEEEKKAAATLARMQALEQCQKRDFIAAHVAAMSDQQFAMFLEQAQAAHARRLKDEADAAAARKAEEAKLAAERAELERIRADQAKVRADQEAEQRRLQAEAQKKLAEERAEIEKQKQAQAEAQRKLDEERRQIELEKARQDAKERAEKDAQAKIERDRQEAQKKAEADERARQQAEARRPDRIKLLGVADALDAITVPKVSEEAAGLAFDIQERVKDLAGDIRALVDKFAAEVDEARELARV